MGCPSIVVQLLAGPNVRPFFGQSLLTHYRHHGTAHILSSGKILCALIHAVSKTVHGMVYGARCRPRFEFKSAPFMGTPPPTAVALDYGCLRRASLKISCKDEPLNCWEVRGLQAMALQCSMCFRPPPRRVARLMSRRSNPHYDDGLSSNETVQFYEGHDAPRTTVNPVPKKVGQPRFDSSGKMTVDGRFANRA